jgi:hypothetical protein
VQLAGRHSTLASGYAQAELFTPSQAPAHAEPVPAHAVRAPCGAPAIGAHVPGLAVESQASHWPVQVVLQHTPSTQ